MRSRPLFARWGRALSADGRASCHRDAIGAQSDCCRCWMRRCSGDNSDGTRGGLGAAPGDTRGGARVCHHRATFSRDGCCAPNLCAFLASSHSDDGRCSVPRAALGPTPGRACPSASTPQWRGRLSSAAVYEYRISSPASRFVKLVRGRDLSRIPVIAESCCREYCKPGAARGEIGFGPLTETPETGLQPFALNLD